MIRIGIRFIGVVKTATKNISMAYLSSSIFRPNIQLGKSLQPSTTKMAVAGLKCNADSLEVFHIIVNNM